MSKYSLKMLLALGFFVGLISLIPRGKGTAALSKQYFWKNKVTQKPTYDYVVAGDSRVYRGFPAEVLGNAFNFGFSSASITPYFIEKAASLLKPDGKKVLILGVTPHSLSGPYKKYNKHLKGLEKKWSKNVDLVGLAGGDKTYSFDSFIKDPTDDLTRHFQGSKAPKRVTYYRSGFVGTATMTESHKKALDSYKKTFSKVRFDPGMMNSSCEMISELVERDYKVFFYFPPVPQSMKEMEEKLGGFDFSHFAKIWAYCGAERIATDGDYLSYDGSHINESSAYKLAEMIRIKLARR